MRNISELQKESDEILAEAIDLYKPSVLFGMFSGGHDSRCAVEIASRHHLFAGCVHINTGIGIEQTRDYVRQTCQENNWPLREMRSPITYESLVLKWGFPGPAGHGIMYTRLKERCIRTLVKENKKHSKDRILLVAGIRQDESKRRQKRCAHQREFCRVWCSPLIYWTREERDAFFIAKGFKGNPVVAKLCMSGECLCGAFAKPGERLEIAEHFPEAIKQIEELEAKAFAAGVHSKWGTRPPLKRHKDILSPQQDLFSLCWSCGNQRAPIYDEEIIV